MRESITKEKIEIVVTLYFNGVGTKIIMASTNLGRSTIEYLTRAARLLKQGDYIGVLKTVGADKVLKLTDKKCEMIGWICEALKIESPSIEVLTEEWKKLVGEKEEKPEEDSREPEQITFKGSEALLIYGTLKYMLDHNPIQKVIDYINDQFDKLK